MTLLDRNGQPLPAESVGAAKAIETASGETNKPLPLSGREWRPGAAGIFSVHEHGPNLWLICDLDGEVLGWATSRDRARAMITARHNQTYWAEQHRLILREARLNAYRNRKKEMLG